MGPILSVETTTQSYRGSTRGPSGPKNNPPQEFAKNFVKKISIAGNEI